jgi:hypothetical protein
MNLEPFVILLACMLCLQLSARISKELREELYGPLRTKPSSYSKCVYLTIDADNEWKHCIKKT